jgi:hypothetical protein
MTDFLNNSNVFVVYKSKRAYPLYLIKYVRHGMQWFTLYKLISSFYTILNIKNKLFLSTNSYNYKNAYQYKTV